MPQVVASNGPPGGRRAGRALVAQRLNQAEELMLAGAARKEVVAALRATHGVSERTADDYIRRVRDRWRLDGAPAREKQREVAVARLRALSSTAEKRGAFAAAVNAERLLADLLGLRSAKRLEVDANLLSELRPELAVAIIPAITRLARQGQLNVTDELRAEARSLAESVGAFGLVVYLPEETDEDALARGRERTADDS